MNMGIFFGIIQFEKVIREYVKLCPELILILKSQDQQFLCEDS